jgi:hypothetical protein
VDCAVAFIHTGIHVSDDYVHCYDFITLLFRITIINIEDIIPQIKTAGGGGKCVYSAVYDQ